MREEKTGWCGTWAEAPDGTGALPGAAGREGIAECTGGWRPNWGPLPGAAAPVWEPTLPWLADVLPGAQVSPAAPDSRSRWDLPDRWNLPQAEAPIDPIVADWYAEEAPARGLRWPETQAEMGAFDPAGLARLGGIAPLAAPTQVSNLQQRPLDGPALRGFERSYPAQTNNTQQPWRDNWEFMPNVPRASVGLAAVLDSPHGTVLTDPALREQAVEFLRRETARRGGYINLLDLDIRNNIYDRRIFNAISKLTRSDADISGDRMELINHLHVVLPRSGVGERNGADPWVLDAALVAVLCADSRRLMEMIAASAMQTYMENNRARSMGAVQAAQGVAGLVGAGIVGSGKKALPNNPLPNAKKAIIDPRKVTGYALNPNHADGRHKAKVFQSALGFNQSNANELIRQVKRKLPNYEAILRGSNQKGYTFRIDMPITGPNGRTVLVRTGWIIHFNTTTPRLTTIYVIGG